MRRWLIALAPAIVLVVLLGYALGSRVMPQSVADNFANAASAPDISSLPDDNVAGALPGAPTNQTIAAAVPDYSAVPAPAGTSTSPRPAADAPDVVAAQDMDGARDDDDPEAQARREIARAIRKATLSALDSGEPTHWHKDGLVGYIVVSVPQGDRQGGSCRTVSATMGTPDDQKQSGDHVWCQSVDDGEWAPQ